MKRALFFLCAGLLLRLTPVALAQDPAPQVSVKPVLINLDNPTGLAFQPTTQALYVADSGAKRILRLEVPTRKIEVSIKGFPQDVYGKGPMYNIGPLGLAFLNEQTLVVGDGGLPDGQELVRIYTVPAAGTTITADQMASSLGPIPAGEQSAMGEGNFYGVAIGSLGIYVTCNGDDNAGWISMSRFAEGMVPGPLTPFIKTKEITSVDAPIAVTMNSEGRLVVGQGGEVNMAGDGLLSIYDADTGALVMSAPSGLSDLCGLAYSPKSGKLYGVDFAWADTTQGGLFRLDVTVDPATNAMTVAPVKIVALDKPTALAFNPEGVLYVTAFGTPVEGDTKKPGQVLEIQGDL